MDNLFPYLRNYRERRKLTQKELGTLIGVTQQVISKYERRRATPSLKTAIYLADVLDVSLPVLLGLSVSVVERRVDKDKLWMRCKEYYGDKVKRNAVFDEFLDVIVALVNSDKVWKVV